MINMLGKKFGRLTVIRREYPNRKYWQSVWLCKCECGKEKIVYGTSLKSGNTKSCGCLKTDLAGNQKRLNYGLANIRLAMSNYKRRAKRKGQEYNLTEEQFIEFTQKDCHYCGAKPNNKNIKKGCNGDYIYNGLDRIDNTKGYTINNVVPCCKPCNSAKGKLTLQEFKNKGGETIAKRLVDFSI